MANVSLKKDFKDGDKLYGQQLNNNFGAIEAALGAMNKIVWQDDPDDSVTAFRGTTQEIADRDIIEGQLLYDITTGETYIDFNGERVSTGSGNSIHIGSDTPDNDATQLWIDPTEDFTNIGSEVVNTLDGNENYKAPSVYAIKSANTYSTDEVKTGDTWIDGKPIYRKVIEIGALPDNDYKGVNHNITNLDKVTKLYMIVNISDGYFYQANMQGTSSLFGGNTVVVRGNSTQIQVGTTADYSNHTGYAVIEYTKTTDGSDS